MATTTFAAAAPAAPAEGVGAGVRKLFQNHRATTTAASRVVLESGADRETGGRRIDDSGPARLRARARALQTRPQHAGAATQCRRRFGRARARRDGAQSDDDHSQSEAEAASSDDDDDASSKSSKSSHEWSDDGDDDDDAPEIEQPRPPPVPARMRSEPSEASEPTPPSAAAADESSDEDTPPAGTSAAPQQAAPSAAPRASPTRPRPPAPPRAPVRRTATSGGDSDDSDSEESDDEDDPNREAIVLSQPEPEPALGDSSQEPESQGEVPPEPYSQQGPSGVEVSSFDAGALWDRISKATPPPRLRLPPPPVEVLDSTQDRWWQILEAAKWKNDEVRRGLDKVKFAGDRSGLDCRHLPPLAVLRDQGFKALVVDEDAANNFQKHLKGTYYDSNTLIHCYGFEVTSYSWVGLYKGVDGAPPEIVAVVANGTSVTHEAFV